MSVILIVDDEPGLRSALRRLLERRSHTVLEAPDGRRALALADFHTPDVVITDILMPDGEGISTIRSLRQSWPELRIVAMSGGGRIGPTPFLEAAEAAGADATLAKPIRGADLDRVLGRLMTAADPGHG